MTEKDVEGYKNACEIALYNELAAFLAEEQVQLVLKWKWSLYEALERFQVAYHAAEQLEAYAARQEP